MKHLYYVAKGKPNSYNGHYKRLHAADNKATFCGKVMDNGWCIVSDCGRTPADITCPACRKVLQGRT